MATASGSIPGLLSVTDQDPPDRLRRTQRAAGPGDHRGKHRHDGESGPCSRGQLLAHRHHPVLRHRTRWREHELPVAFKPVAGRAGTNLSDPYAVGVRVDGRALRSCEAASSGRGDVLALSPPGPAKCITADGSSDHVDVDAFLVEEGVDVARAPLGAISAQLVARHADGGV